MVPFASLLREVRALHDLPRFFAALGYEPLWQELPDGALVGRAGEFLWTAWERQPGEESAAARASRLARGGRIAGVAALDRGGRGLDLAVGFHGDPARRFSLAHPSPIDLARLERLRPVSDEPALATAARVADALAGEAAGRRFFREFRRTLIRVREALPSGIPADDRHALALLQLTRVLVLYFVQARGWLDGRPRFLRDEIDRCMAAGRSIHRDLLRPLFFGTLNRPLAERSRTVARLGRIPFLNGGLFEPHPIERRWPADLPTGIWLDSFDELFERFHFVTRADGGSGIAPDMLGQVFEGVMEPDLRLASGSFYTPADLVEAVVREGLTALLATRLRIGAAQAERLLIDPSPAARTVLERITVLDPAVGSGAFLLGALDLLAAPWRGHPAGFAARKRAIVTRNLFGVDLNANAVRLAELRLWLDVIASDLGDAPEDVAPLPNLDALLRQGDSLADPSRLDAPRAPGLAAMLGGLRARLAVVSGPAKREAARALRLAEREAFVVGIAEAEARTERRIAELLQRARSPTLFGTRSGIDRAMRAELADLRAERRRYRAMRRRGQREEVVPWFHYQSHFADLFAERGGFDLVIGNPPWVRAERIEPARRTALAARYHWWRGGRSGAAGYVHRPDLAVAFLQRATELAAPGGTIAMLVPAKLATAEYAATARAELAGRTTLHLVAELTEARPRAFDATVYPLALVCSRGAAPPGHRVRTGLDRAVRIPQSRLSAAPWILVPDPLRDALEQLRADHPRLDERYACHLGAKTGCNRVFLDPPDDVEPELVRWAIRGRDVGAFRVEPRRRLLWTHAASGDPLPALPPRAAAWIASHRRALEARRDFTAGPLWTVFRAGPASAEHRVVWADLARRLDAATLTGAEARQAVPLNSCYLLAPDTRAAALRLTAWLNTTWLRAAARVGADPAANGFARFNARVVGGLPLPHSVLLDPDLAALTSAGQSGRFRQEDLDDTAARHLSLGPAHRRALAGGLGTRAGAGR